MTIKRGSIERKDGLYPALTVLLVLLSLTLYQWHSISQQAMSSATQRFDFRVTEIVTAMEQRIRANENVLQGAAGLFAASAHVRAEDWRAYTQSLELRRNFPGIQGLGWSRAIRPEGLESLVEEVRARGYPDFLVWPEGERPLHTPIIYLEPFGWRNRRAFGFDMFSEPTRRQAMERARDTGQATATAAVSLVQETRRDVQHGFLVYVAVYQRGSEPATVAERREQLLGFVYSPFRVRNLVQGILGAPEASGTYENHPLHDIQMEIFDGVGIDPVRRIYSSTGESGASVPEQMLTTMVPLEFQGHQWTLRFASLPPLEALAQTFSSKLFLVGGTVISFLLAGFIWMLWLSHARRRALNQANHDLMQEITQREHLELRLERFFSLSTDMLCTLNLDGTLRSVNPAWQAILGFQAREVEGQQLITTIHTEDRKRVGDELAALASRQSDRATMEVRNLTADGDVRWVEWHLVTAEDEPALYANGRDVSIRRQMEQQLQHSAFYDALTGMANRALFLDRLEHVIERAYRYGERYAVLIMDVDNFKNVNDSHGHLVGDQLLIAFARCVQRQLRPVDTCARFGGDEFILLLEAAACAEDVRLVVQRIQLALDVPFLIEGHEIRVTSSMGVTVGDSGYKNTQQVLRDADMALYEAKRQGKSRYLLFDAKMRKEQLTRKAVENELSQALSRHELDVVYQPIIDLQTNRVVGCEALVRWEHPQLGKMLPEDFIPVAEDSGLITAIGRFVTETACRDLAKWLANTQVSSRFYVGVNLSPREFFAGNLVANIQQVLARTGLQGHNLRLEVTEGVLIDRQQDAASIFSRLQAMGVQICIDDFGTGYSSLSYLQSLPINVLKLDRSLIEQIEISSKSHEIARTVLSLANALGVQSVAEGVETDAQLQAIMDLGFDFAQGFCLHRPMNSQSIQTLLQQSRVAENS